MTKAVLLPLAERAIQKTLDLADSKLNFELPRDCLHGIYLKGLMGGSLYSIESAIECLLTSEGLFPPIVDLAVRGILEDKPLVVWIRSGHPDVCDLEDTWNDGFGPFKPMGLMIPSHFGNGKSLLSRDKMEAIGQAWPELAAQ